MSDKGTTSNPTTGTKTKGAGAGSGRPTRPK